MGAVFARRFTSDPGNAVLLEIESVNILDLSPPTSIQGIGTGTVICVGEFENGPFATTTEVTSADDLLATFGSLGYVRSQVPANDCCAVARKADGAINAEYWNGNGFVQLSGKKFSRLLIVRADTSVGSVTLTPIPFVEGSVSNFRFDLTAGDVLALDIGSGPVNSTFSAGAAVRTGAAGTYPTGFVGGETITIGYDDQPDFVVTFLATDGASIAAVIARINATAGFTFADTPGGNALRLTSRQLGTAAQARVTGASAPGVLTALGLTAGTTTGTGNVANIDAVTPTEVNTIVNAAMPTVTVVQLDDGRLRAKSTSGTSITVTAGTTATGLGFAVGTVGGTVPTAGTLPAGTVVRVPSGNRYVTMQDLSFAAAATAAQTVKVRPATDDGTATSANAGTVTLVESPPAIGAFSVQNLAPLSAALSEAAIDAAYATAIDVTKRVNTIAKQANMIFSARQSNAIRQKLRSNAIEASANGMYGRIAFVRPPLGTTKTVAKSSTTQPGVGATRSERVVYCYPGANTFVPLIAQRGTAGGTGFTADGNVDVGLDGFVASTCSQLAPEENPGQETEFTANINGLETSANVQGFEIGDYKLFKLAGICCLRMDDGVAIFQSGVVSVDPTIYPQLKNIARRRMADFIEDTLSDAAKKYGKKLSTVKRRIAIVSEIRQFLQTLKDGERIEDFSIDTSQNTPSTLAAGIYRIAIFVRTIASLDSIVIAATIGETVDVTLNRAAA